MVIPECVAKGSRFTLWGSGGGGVFAGRRFGVRERSLLFCLFFLVALFKMLCVILEFQV